MGSRIRITVAALAGLLLRADAWHAAPRARRATRRAAGGGAEPPSPMPQLVVLDLDECVWSPEMYTLDELPGDVVRGELLGAGAGARGVKSGPYTIAMYDGALRALQRFHAGEYPGTRLAVASSADTPRAVQIGRAAMRVLEVVPGVTMHDVLSDGWADEINLQIGRSKPLSSDKSRTHFPILRDLTGVPYEGMLFFDDSNWSDHCGIVERNCPGVVTQRTPRGMTEFEWEQGLKKYAQRYGG